MRKIITFFSDLSIPLKILLSFLTVIIVGSLILNLQISQIETSEATYFDHLFITISMVCVTGLYTQSVVATYNIFGQIICMFLMKLGGLGLLTIVSAFYLRLGSSIRMKDRVTVNEALSHDKLFDFKSFILSVVKFTTLFEIIGALLLMTYFVPHYGPSGAFSSLFMAISGFNNAGFDNMGTNSLQNFASVPIVNIVIPSLIIIGGIGFNVWFDIGHTVKKIGFVTSWNEVKSLYRKLHLHTRLVLNWTTMLLISGTLFFLLFEWTNPNSIGQLNIFDKFQVAFFQSATMRTAGFATIDYTNVHVVSIILFSVLMFIGGSPGGTAGGAKTSTVAIIFHTLKAEIFGKEYVSYHNRTIATPLIRKAAIIVVMYILLALIGISLIAIFDEHLPLEYILFEVISALATVGVSANVTPELGRLSQTVLMFLMFIGRLGPITVFTALRTRKPKKQNIKYADGKILIG